MAVLEVGDSVPVTDSSPAPRGPYLGPESYQGPHGFSCGWSFWGEKHSWTLGGCSFSVKRREIRF